MGLLYLFPTDSNETEYVIVNKDAQYRTVTIKSYGLAWIFWVYAAAAIALLAILFLSIYNPMLKLLSIATVVDKVLIFSFVLTLLAVLIAIITLLYWQIHLVVNNDSLSIEYRPFGVRIFKRSIKKDENFSLKVLHFLESPNIARMEQDERFKEFQNKGYFELFASNKEQKLLIDRSSRKQDLEDLLSLMSNS